MPTEWLFRTKIRILLTRRGVWPPAGLRVDMRASTFALLGARSELYRGHTGLTTTHLDAMIHKPLALTHVRNATQHPLGWLDREPHREHSRLATFAPWSSQ
jgi:hypothetical protein